MSIASYVVPAIAAIPGIYYVLVIYSTLRYFRVARRENPRNDDFFPPISCLKPIRGLDDDAYENYASFCRQDYPQYEILLCVDPDDQTVLPIVERLRRNFPERTGRKELRIVAAGGIDRTMLQRNAFLGSYHHDLAHER